MFPVTSTGRLWRVNWPRQLGRRQNPFRVPSLWSLSCLLLASDGQKQHFEVALILLLIELGPHAQAVRAADTFPDTLIHLTL